MDIKSVINVAIIVVAALLCVAILMQQQGAGLGGIFGGGGGESYRSKRGVEKLLFNATIILIVAFVFLGLGAMIVGSR